MNDKINELFLALEDILPQLQAIIQNDNVFNRYILPSLVAGIISVVGILINNFVSVYVFRKKRSLEYGRFYLPYLSYLKDIDCEIDLYSSEVSKNNISDILSIIAKSDDVNDIHIKNVLDNFMSIKNLFKQNAYYIINRKINNDVLKMQTLIILLEKCNVRKLEQSELDVIIGTAGQLDFNIKKHIKDIEKYS